MKEWLTLPEYLAAAAISRRTFYNRRDQIESKTIDGVLKYSVASLPGEALTKLAGRTGPQRTENPNKRPAEPSPLALAPLFASGAAATRASQLPIRVDLTPDQAREADRKLAIIQPLLDYNADPAVRVRFQKLALRDRTSVTNVNLLTRYLSETHGVGRTQIFEWKKAYEQDGKFALARKPRKDKNQSSWAAQNRDLADLAASVYIGNNQQPGQSKRVAWEMVCARAANMSVVAPSYETVRSFLDNPTEVSPSMRVLGRNGRKQYDKHFAPYIKRGYTEAANAIWVSDHAIIDTLVQNDIFGERDLRHMRLRMTTLLDYRSRYVVGVSWCEEGSSHSIKRALLRAFSQYGLPESFYCDNGKDYRKIAGGAQRHELKAEGLLRVAECKDLGSSVMKRLGIPVTFCLPYHPQSKHIERYHRTFHERVDKAFRTYTGGAPHLRPDATNAALAQHGKLLQMGQPQHSALPLASEYIQIAEAWIQNWYHLRPQTDSEGMNGRSPAQCFMDERLEGQRPTPEPEMLAMLLCEKVSRKVSNCGVMIDGLRLVPAIGDQYAYIRMHELSDSRADKVIVAFDPLEPQFAAVLDQDMHFICSLEREKLFRMSPDPETQADVKAFIHNRSALAKATRESSQALFQRTRTMGVPTAEETLRQIAQLPAAVGDSTVHRAPKTRDLNRNPNPAPASSYDIASSILGDLL